VATVHERDGQTDGHISYIIERRSSDIWLFYCCRVAYKLELRICIVIFYDIPFNIIIIIIIIIILVQVSVGHMSVAVGNLVYTNHNTHFAMLLATLPVIFVACLTVAALVVVCMRKGHCRNGLRKWKTKSDISYVHVPSPIVRTSSISRINDHTVQDLQGFVGGASVGHVERPTFDTVLSSTDGAYITFIMGWFIMVNW